MVAKFLDNNKPIKSLKSLLFCTISFNLANLGKFSLGAYLLLSKFRERKQQFLFCVHLLHKAGSPVKLGSFIFLSGATTATKWTK